MINTWLDTRSPSLYHGNQLCIKVSLLCCPVGWMKSVNKICHRSRIVQRFLCANKFFGLCGTPCTVSRNADKFELSNKKTTTLFCHLINVDRINCDGRKCHETNGNDVQMYSSEPRSALDLVFIMTSIFVYDLRGRKTVWPVRIIVNLMNIRYVHMW